MEKNTILQLYVYKAVEILCYVEGGSKKAPDGLEDNWKVEDLSTPQDLIKFSILTFFDNKNYNIESINCSSKRIC